MYSENQMEKIYNDLRSHLYANPHTSKVTEDLIDQVRYKILEFFRTDQSNYELIFTKGATESLKTVAECFDFEAGRGHFAYVRSNHTSVLGMREVVQTEKIIPVESGDLLEIGDGKQFPKEVRSGDNSLLVFPAQCNFNGFKYPLSIIDQVHSNQIPDKIRLQSKNWFVCLDAASFVGTSPLNLSLYRPDFVTVSFYKIFGYPTGLGALLVSKRGAKVLQKRYYGGGTVKIAMSSNNFHTKRESLHEQFEDGTVPFLSIIALLHGLATIERLCPQKHGQSSMQRISEYTFNLAKYLYEKLSDLRYRKGQRAVEFYNQTRFESIDTQGGILNLNILHSDGSFVGFSEINCMAEIHNIQLRVGCFCNPGACQSRLGLSDEVIMSQFKAGHVCGDSNDLIDNVPTGTVRLSLGYMTKLENVNAFLEMIQKCYLGRIDVEIVPELTPSISNTPILEQICIYPIKSCAAFKIFSKWEITSRGLKYDRAWMIVSQSGMALTQKTNTRLCLIQPVINERRNVMRISFPSFDPIEISLTNVDDFTKTTNANLCNSKVCGDRVQGVDCGDKVAAWLGRVLDLSGVRLIRQSDEEKRVFKKDQLSEISLANQAQFLLISIPSVKWLMGHVEDYSQEMSCGEFIQGIVDRFRGNLIISSNSPLSEKDWKTIRINEIELKVNYLTLNNWHITEQCHFSGRRTMHQMPDDLHRPKYG